MAETSIHACQSWDDLKRSLYPTLFGGGSYVPGRYLFRGVGDEAWELVSGFDRYAPASPLSSRTAMANQLLDLFIEECESDHAIQSCPNDQKERIAMAQHYGLPTRALDWSDSPYIAAYFAFADATTPSTSANVAVWALDVEHPVWNGSMGARIVRPRGGHSERILRQKAYLTYLDGPYQSLEEFVRACPEPGHALTKFTVPRRDVQAALLDLSAMGITGTRLFPDPTGAARAAKASFQATNP